MLLTHICWNANKVYVRRVRLPPTIWIRSKSGQALTMRNEIRGWNQVIRSTVPRQLVETFREDMSVESCSPAFSKTCKHLTKKIRHRTVRNPRTQSAYPKIAFTIERLHTGRPAKLLLLKSKILNFFVLLTLTNFNIAYSSLFAL